MKIIITGGSGLLGQYLNIELSAENEILTLYNENSGNCHEFNSLQLNLADYSQIKKIFVDFNPDVVIHTGAISRPELCDSLSKKFVNEINVNSTVYISELCRTHNSKLIFTSTDLIYDGDQGQMLTEESIINPISLYAETKILSENRIKDILKNYIILRTSLLFGMGMNHSVNNFHIMLNNFLYNKKVKLFYDQFRTPLSLKNAAEIISQIIKLDIKSETMNFGGRERVSRTDLGEITCKAGNFDLSLIERTSMNDIPNFYKVTDVSMNTGKLQSYGISQKSIEESVFEIIKILGL